MHGSNYRNNLQVPLVKRILHQHLSFRNKALSPIHNLNASLTVFRSIVSITLLFVGLVALTSCLETSRQTTDKLDVGSIENSVYQNNYLGFSIQLPSDWAIEHQSALEQLQKAGNKNIAGQNMYLEVSDLSTVNLFATYKHPLEVSVKSNPKIVCAAQRVLFTHIVKTGQDHLLGMRNAVLESDAGQVTYSFSESIENESLNGHDFAVLNGEITFKNITLKHKYYAKIIKNYALTFLLSYSNDGEKEFLEETLSSIAFK